jgi:hypothetical protein
MLLLLPPKTLTFGLTTTKATLPQDDVFRNNKQKWSSTAIMKGGPTCLLFLFFRNLILSTEVHGA